MDYFSRKVRDFVNYYCENEKEVKHCEITKFEGYLQFIYKVLCWGDYTLTSTVFIILNIFFWFMVQYEIRFLGVIFLALLLLFVIDLYFDGNQILIEKNQYFDAFEELRNDLLDIVSYILAFRKESPSFFSVGMSFIFIVISVVARSISGPILLYLLLLAVFFVPLSISKLSPEYGGNFRKFLKTLGSERGVLAEDELIPFLSDKEFEEKDTDLDSLLTDKTADSVTNSLISGINNMPSHLDAEDVENTLEEDDLLPQKSQDGVSVTPGDLSSDSDSEQRRINFSPAHFNGDTSSEEEHFTDNMKFPSIDTVDTVKGKGNVPGDVMGTVMSNIYSAATISGSYMAHAIKAAVHPPPVRRNSSSGSEFEIIDSDEID